ncbi:MULTISPECIES: hypothetical protein [Brevibacterium]|uniref:Uncharacterized protein n=1 Tax=Brevibacterium pityocampae TaxID=506594 RepID=A0ABP8JA16_9MICO|nr:MULTISPECIES: hypothetical protein [unclassified Brevibacterium]MCK1803276.1 hypothetical protein [Brevibacterium sp. R8603A2]QCP04347.1 hypothetical protein FDF13_02700 [Brevibacterium sp. CS2]
MSRRARQLTAEQKVLVNAVRRIARQRSRVNANYVAAILRAREEEVTYSAIADAAGTSSQAVQEIVRRHRESNENRSGSFGVAGDIAAISSQSAPSASAPEQGPSGAVT